MDARLQRRRIFGRPRKIRLYGIDMPAGARKNGPRLAIDSALTFLSRADPTRAQEIRESFGDSLARVDAGEFGSLPAPAQAAFEMGIRAVAKAMRKVRKRLIAAGSEGEYRWAVHNLDVARQLARCLPIAPAPNASNSLWARVEACRDSAMADNVQWAVENEGPKALWPE
jgi:erythromycin esterase-like protein